ncbi:integral membrane protein S linking to the trans Golgi network-domain-containing protein [Schizothecium vesticola]|uniref:Integral membrane protein S linking to the trans Golgi network-domain-containing protein n=1 Tax=Schizothecium vesticola TaxID=314040 RepID=A0AA40F2Q9_9PEZI|nr:integral membrane protein S linking to the trans Golgi network-domain-containing protein [Schizothecium vesticola]
MMDVTVLLALQALFYAALLALTLFACLVAGSAPFTLDLVLGWRAVRGDTTQGWLMGFLLVLAGGFFHAAALVMLVGRSKLVLDFALSLHALHAVVATVYTGEVPGNMAWWVSVVGSSVVAVGLGTWGCRYRELRPIAFGGVGGGTAGGGSGVGGTAEEEGDEESGFARGRGRGRGRDGEGGMGVYEGCD